MLTHMLWVRGPLSRLERLACVSFVKSGFDVVMWTYGDVPNLPAGVVRRDAGEILSEDLLFLNSRGSYAGFSDYFRYAVLKKHGGLYVDADVIALRPVTDMPAKPFFVTERREGGGVKVNGNVIFCPSPCAGDVVDLAFHYTANFPKNKVTWSEIGPDLLTFILGSYKLHGCDVLEPDFANPVGYRDCPAALLAPGVKLPPAAHFLHCYNEMWRRSGVDKSNAPPPNSLLAKLEHHFGFVA